MNFYTTQHPYYCGIDLHARSLYVCILLGRDCTELFVIPFFDIVLPSLLNLWINRSINLQT